MPGAGARVPDADLLGAVERVRRGGDAVLGEIARARAGNLVHDAEPAHHQVAVGERAGSHNAVDAFANQVDETLALTDLDAERGVSRQEAGQLGQQDGAREIAGHVDPDEAAHRIACATLGLLDIGEDLHAAPVIGFALDRRRDVPCRALQQPGAEPLLQRLDRGGRDRTGHAEVGGGGAEAAALHNAGEKLEAAEAVHRCCFAQRNNDVHRDGLMRRRPAPDRWTTQPRFTMAEQTRIAIVTGGSRGLGRSTVLALAARGVDTIFTYNSNRSAADEVIALAERAGARSRPIQLDTGAAGGFNGFVGQVRDVLGGWRAERFDYLVNNAGTSHHASIEAVTEADFDALYRVHVKGVFFLTQALLPLINDGGRIVNLSSGLTRIVFPGSAAYGAMKGAVEVLTKYMAKELGPRRIAVNVVAPGAIQTDFSGGMVRDNPDVNRQVAAATALGRAGVPDDVGPMIASLLSEDQRWVNAQRIEVSGGMMI